MSPETYKSILANYLPSPAIDPIYDFMNHYSVHFHITRQRTSKLGDYRWPQPKHNYQEISVNGNLNKYEFLMVLLHEMAHLNTHQRYATEVQPHGHEWQEQYALLLKDYLNCFPDDIAELIVAYTHRIPLSRTIEKRIDAQLKHYNEGYVETECLTVNNLAPGICFRIKAKPQKVFRTIEKRRTRWLCEEAHSGQKFLVSGEAEIEIVD